MHTRWVVWGILRLIYCLKSWVPIDHANAHVNANGTRTKRTSSYVPGAIATSAVIVVADLTWGGAICALGNQNQATPKEANITTLGRTMLLSAPPVTWRGIAIGIDAALQTPADLSEQVTCSRARGAKGGWLRARVRPEVLASDDSERPVVSDGVVGRQLLSREKRVRPIVIIIVIVFVVIIAIIIIPIIIVIITGSVIIVIIAIIIGQTSERIVRELFGALTAKLVRGCLISEYLQ